MSANVDQKRVLKFNTVADFNAAASTLDFPGLFMIAGNTYDGDAINKTYAEAVDEGIKIPVINFLNNTMKAKMIDSGFDTNNDGEIDRTEASAITTAPDGLFKDFNASGLFDDFKYFTGLTTVSTSMFENNSGLTVTMPSSITHIGQYGFRNTGYTSLNLSNYIFDGEGPFMGCTQLQTVELNNTNVVAKMFANCSSLTYAKITTTGTDLGDNCFSNCPNLTTVDLTVSPVYSQYNSWWYQFSIGSYCFFQSPNIEKIIIRFRPNTRENCEYLSSYFTVGTTSSSMAYSNSTYKIYIQDEYYESALNAQYQDNTVKQHFYRLSTMPSD